MTPKFWKYLINNGDTSAIRFVAEEDREWAEKELEGDPRLLSYTAKPQFESAVFRRPAEGALQRLRRTTARPTKNGGEPNVRFRSNHQQHVLASVPEGKRHVG